VYLKKSVDISQDNAEAPQRKLGLDTIGTSVYTVVMFDIM
jgi:hypothetical protein